MGRTGISRRSFTSLLGGAAVAVGCGVEDEGTAVGPSGGGKADEVSDSDEELAMRVGAVFQAEHFHAEISSAVLSDIEHDPPGSIIFWNANRASGAGVREVVRRYSAANKAAGHLPLLFATDYEGGALRRSLTWKSISGIQRFTGGMTPLAHPRWLGRAFDDDPALGRELARLHGQLIADELRDVGINYPLSVVADLAFNLFAVRGIDRDAPVVAELLVELFEGFVSVPDVVFATKHFPGLGQTRGDTHDEVVVSPVTDRDTAERHLSPFRAIVGAAQELDEGARLSIMCSHAKFPAFDPDLNTTTSSAILVDLLREDVGFDRGIALSDAMWMGPYGSMGTSSLHRVYLQAFIAGLDMLMIPGAKFRGARNYFRSVLLDEVSNAERMALQSHFGGLPFSEIRLMLSDRLAQSITRSEAVRGGLAYPVDYVGDEGEAASDATADLRQRYDEILIEVDARWSGELG
jgi:beta-N-acetylhexosaminidase